MIFLTKNFLGVKEEEMLTFSLKIHLSNHQLENSAPDFPFQISNTSKIIL